MTGAAALLVSGMSCAALLGSALVAQPAGAQSSTPEVSVVDPGAEPRQVLQYAWQPGTTVTSRLSTQLSITQRQGDQTRSQDAPETSITLSTTVASIAPDGNATVDVAYEDASVEDDGSLSDTQLEQVQESLDAIEGVTGSLVMAPSGAVIDSQLQIPDDVDPTVQQLLEQLDEQAAQLGVPFPAEAVGEGARWQAVQEVEASGLDFRQEATYRLREIDGQELTLAVRVRQSADPQTIDTPQGTVEVQEFTGKGKGTTVTVLTEPLPGRSNLRLNVRQQLAGGGTTLEQTIRTKVRLERA
jgi:hypothetical protein